MNNVQKDNKYVAHVISHTHWDREWYLTFQQFRIRLIDLIDNLLEILEKDPDYIFHLDGQTIVLEDYLEIKPEKEQELKNFIKNGRIKIGPWYILPDEFLVSGESLVRNLLKGINLSKKFGEPMMLGYIPDMFGHISQMPSILNNFNINSAIFWRGQGDKNSPFEFVWEGDDGSQVLTAYLHSGYCNLSSLSIDFEQALKQVQLAIKEEKSGTIDNQLLIMNGCDHLEAQPHVPNFIQEANKELEDVKLVHSSLPEFVQAMKADLKDKYDQLKKYKGEFRLPADEGEIFPGILSSRIYLKELNHRIESLLEKWVEPFAAISSIYGDKDKQQLIKKAWEYLLKNQPHDSICGCSIDRVHNQMLTRYEWAEEICEEVRDRSLNSLIEKIDYDKFSDYDQLLVIFNPEDESRTEVFEDEIKLLKAPLKIESKFSLNYDYEDELKYFVIEDINGQRIPYQVLSEEDVQDMKLYPFNLTQRIDKKKLKLAIMAEGIPPIGFKVYGLKFKDNFYKNCFKNEKENAGIKATYNSLENEYLKIIVQDNGALTIIDKKTNQEYIDCNLFVDGADTGDEYNYSPPKFDKVYTTNTSTLNNIALLDSGPLLGKIEIIHTLDLPGQISDDRSTCSSNMKECQITTHITLKAGSQYLEVKTVVDNQVKDHRLRVYFPLNVKVNNSYAEGSFTVNNRPVKLPKTSLIEDTYTTYPQKSFVDITDDDRGLAVFNQGLPEYEIINKDTVALTLLRSVGWLARDDFLTRSSSIGAERSLPTPGAQCIGRYEFNYAIMPHQGNWQSAKVHKLAHQYNNRLKVKQKRLNEEGENKKRELSNTFKFVEINSDQLCISTIKRSEDGKKIVFRVFNISDQPVDKNITFDHNVKKVYYSNMAEENKGEMQYINSEVNVKFNPHQIVTLLLQT